MVSQHCFGLMSVSFGIKIYSNLVSTLNNSTTTRKLIGKMCSYESEYKSSTADWEFVG